MSSRNNGRKTPFAFPIWLDQDARKEWGRLVKYPEVKGRLQSCHRGILARRSIARFADLQRKSGIPFYHESGHLALAERSTDPENYVNQVDRVARQLGVTCEVCEDGDLHHRFPFLKVLEGSTGRFLPNNPLNDRYYGRIAAKER